MATPRALKAGAEGALGTAEARGAGEAPKGLYLPHSQLLCLKQPLPEPRASRLHRSPLSDATERMAGDAEQWPRPSWSQYSVSVQAEAGRLTSDTHSAVCVRRR
jgi:hypothetical protein